MSKSAKIEIQTLSGTISRAFEYYEEQSGKIRVDYFNDPTFLQDSDNGYFLSGNPTQKFVQLLNKWEKDYPTTWRYAIADNTPFDGRALLTSDSDVIDTNYDSLIGDKIAGIGDTVDLKLIEVFDIKDPIVPTTLNTLNLSGDILSGQFINDDNYFKYMEYLEPGYFYLDNKEYYLYPTKITEHIAPTESGGLYVYDLSGKPDPFYPIIANIDVSGIVEPFINNEYIIETGVWAPDHAGVAPGSASKIQLISGDVLVSSNEYTSGTIYHAPSNSIISNKSGALNLVYSVNENTPFLTDLSPLSYYDKDRILAITTDDQTIEQTITTTKSNMIYSDKTLPFATITTDNIISLAQDNLLKNGDFSQADSNNEPLYWRAYSVDDNGSTQEGVGAVSNGYYVIDAVGPISYYLEQYILLANSNTNNDIILNLSFNIYSNITKNFYISLLDESQNIIWTNFESTQTVETQYNYTIILPQFYFGEHLIVKFRFHTGYPTNTITYYLTDVKLSYPLGHLDTDAYSSNILTIGSATYGVEFDRNTTALNLIDLNTLVVDQNNQPIIGTNVDYELLYECDVYSGDVLSGQAEVLQKETVNIYDEYNIDKTFLNDKVSQLLSEPEHIYTLPLYTKYTIEDLSGDMCAINDYPAGHSGDVCITPLFAGFVSDDVVDNLSGSIYDVANSIDYSTTITTDEKGIATAHLNIINIYDKPTKLKMKITTQNTNEYKEIIIVPKEQNNNYYTNSNGFNIVPISTNIELDGSGQVLKLASEPLGHEYNMALYDMSGYINDSGNPQAIDFSTSGYVFNMNDEWFMYSDLSGSYLLKYYSNFGSPIFFDSEYVYTENNTTPDILHNGEVIYE